MGSICQKRRRWVEVRSAISGTGSQAKQHQIRGKVGMCRARPMFAVLLTTEYRSQGLCSHDAHADRVARRLWSAAGCVRASSWYLGHRSAPHAFLKQCGNASDPARIPRLAARTPALPYPGAQYGHELTHRPAAAAVSLLSVQVPYPIWRLGCEIEVAIGQRILSDRASHPRHAMHHCKPSRSAGRPNERKPAIS